MSAPRPVPVALLAGLIGLVSGSAPPARGAGFSIYEQGAAATALGGAWTAIADSPAALFYNPAGIAFQRGLGIELGDTLIVPLGSRSDPGTGSVTDAEVQVFYPPTFYASYGFPSGWAVGLGVYAPYGLGMRWPDGWAGFEEVEAIDLQTFFLNPTVAWSPVEWFSLAAGFDVVRSTVSLQKGIQFFDERGTLQGGAGAWGLGGNAGALLRILDGRLSFGVSYRSAVRLEYSGDADFTVPDSFASALEDQPLESTLLLPHTISIGVAGIPHEMVTLDLDVLVTTWSTFEEFGFRFPEDEGKPEDEQLTQFERRDWEDTFSVRFGAEVRPPVEGLALRAGFVYDRTPSPSNTMSPSLPDCDRIDVSAGAGYRFDFGLSVDLAYMYVHFLGRSSTGEAFPGSYEASAHIAGLSLGYRLEPGER